MLPPLFLVANGDISDLDWLKSNLNRQNSAILGVDGGTNYILDAGFIPDIVIGDLDSISEAHIKYLEDNWVNIFRHQKDKDETDLELALVYVANNPPWHDVPIEIFGGMGGRFDHEIANLMLLTHPLLSDLDIRLRTPFQSSFIITKQSTIKGRAGDTVSLIPLKGDALISKTENLKWELINSTLKFGPARGVSNTMTSSVASIELERGLVLCVHTESSWQR